MCIDTYSHAPTHTRKQVPETTGVLPESHTNTHTHTHTHTESPLDPEVKESAKMAAEFGANKTCQEAVFFFGANLI